MMFIVSTSCGNRVAQFDPVLLSPPPMDEYPKGYIPDSTDVYAIIKFDSKQMRYVFPASYKAAEITPMEMKAIDSLIIISVKNYNIECKKKGLREIMKLKLYRRQLVAAIDTDGNKQVYVNAFTMWPGFEKSWKQHLSYVSDGGSGFFNLKISLNKKLYYSFGVNGLA